MIETGGAAMPHYEFLDIPAVNVRGSGPGVLKSVKQAASVANQLDKSRVIGRVFGSAGHDITFEDMKAQTDLVCALGVNYISPQHVLYSMTGEKKTDKTQKQQIKPADSWIQRGWLQQFDTSGITWEPEDDRQCQSIR